jgi:hypothetical protein
MIFYQGLGSSDKKTELILLTVKKVVDIINDQ